jgi:CBS domain-containing protein
MGLMPMMNQQGGGEMKRKVRELIEKRGLKGFVSVNPDANILEALSMLEHTNASALPVVDDGRLVGIVSEKDFARASLRMSASLFSKVRSIMVSKVYFVDPDYTLESCLQIMSRLHIRHLPVIEHGQLLMVLSMRHVMEFLVEDRDDQIHHLMTYIAASGVAIAGQKPDPEAVKPYMLVPPWSQAGTAMIG